MKKTILDVFLTFNSIQVCEYTNKKRPANTEIVLSKFATLLVNLTACNVIFESSNGENYWCQLAESLGNDAGLISPQWIMAVKQNQQALIYV